jgi:hypothetical protein
MWQGRSKATIRLIGFELSIKTFIIAKYRRQLKPVKTHEGSSQ